MTDRWIDIGHDHAIRYYSWAPDDLPENRATYGVPLPNVAKAGAHVRHKKPDGSECMSSVAFDTPEMQRGNWQGAKWQVESWEPLTISPSLLCSCGDHGFIRAGTWVPA